jgi:hypothetical protein
MALRNLTLLLLCLGVPLHAAHNDPFPDGFSMLTFGAIIQGDRISGRQPWIPACFARDSAVFCLASSYINYYDAMDNLRGADFRKATLGLRLNLGRVGVKAAAAFFNALGIYEEHRGFLSVAMRACPFLQISAELDGRRAGLIGDRDESETTVYCGLSCWIPWSFASFSLSCGNILIENSSQPGFTQPLSLRFGLHTMPHRLGAFGVLITAIPEERFAMNLSTGYEIRIHKLIACDAGVSFKPLMVSLGLVLSLPRAGVYTGFVHHPVLGWSQGVGMEYVRWRR